MPSYLLFVSVTTFSALSLFCPTLYLIYRINDKDTSGFMKHILQQELPGVIISVLAGIFLSTIVFFFTVWQQAVEREQQSSAEALKYKYKNLKAQINPHFLFNSLNTLSEIVYVDAKNADHYIQMLAAIYRYILDNEETDLISLHEEFRFINRYFELQKERDGEKIRLEIDFPHPERYKTIPISLQILIENALKHNSASEENPLHIHIQENDGYVVVSNNIQKRNTLNASHGTGLANLKERLNLIIGKEMTIEMKNNLFIVKLPIIRSQI
ncbi:two-component system LytT family sensor kinase [Parabacteroides sp. PF5-6]|nr:two-component system LytT family sensor kinase [Parabacteroides sp. PF5-6]